MSNTPKTRFPQGEYSAFSTALRKILQVSHSEIQDRIAATKKAKGRECPYCEAGPSHGKRGFMSVTLEAGDVITIGESPNEQHYKLAEEVNGIGVKAWRLELFDVPTFMLE